MVHCPLNVQCPSASYNGPLNHWSGEHALRSRCQCPVTRCLAHRFISVLRGSVSNQHSVAILGLGPLAELSPGVTLVTPGLAAQMSRQVAPPAAIWCFLTFPVFSSAGQAGQTEKASVHVYKQWSFFHRLAH
ncbi:hypothetical protein DPEC_G00134850 [Dallia pectoralis]|uniref:Uncharacterized protein n=1 Tax=Dallia pectoralis TaxID=75939 RepID=A0ACC2GS32_DALPE|nr:hypothetical protein DPEC_G00134850 [Dallia pectoralis]